MKLIQVYFIYVYDSLKGWTKCSRNVNPIDGYEYEEDAIKHLIPLTEMYPGKEYTVMVAWKSNN